MKQTFASFIERTETNIEELHRRGKQNMYSREDHVSLALEHHIDDIEMRQGWL